MRKLKAKPVVSIEFAQGWCGVGGRGFHDNGDGNVAHTGRREQYYLQVPLQICRDGAHFFVSFPHEMVNETPAQKTNTMRNCAQFNQDILLRSDARNCTKLILFSFLQFIGEQCFLVPHPVVGLRLVRLAVLMSEFLISLMSLMVSLISTSAGVIVL